MELESSCSLFLVARSRASSVIFFCSARASSSPDGPPFPAAAVRGAAPRVARRAGLRPLQLRQPLHLRVLVAAGAPAAVAPRPHRLLSLRRLLVAVLLPLRLGDVAVLAVALRVRELVAAHVALALVRRRRKVAVRVLHLLLVQLLLQQRRHPRAAVASRRLRLRRPPRRGGRVGRAGHRCWLRGRYRCLCCGSAVALYVGLMPKVRFLTQ